MEFLTQLWLPIILSGVALFFASFVAWTILPHHRKDFDGLPDEDRLMQAIRDMNLPTGSYMFPWCASHQDAQQQEYQDRYRKGPRGLITTWGEVNMGRNLLLTFLFFLATGFMTAYIAWEAMGALPASGRFLKAFQITGAIGVLTHASSGLCHAIWFPRRVLSGVWDGIAFGLIAGLIFAYFWPVSG